MIVLLQPPFFKCAGSHNDRAPLELCYASRFLDDAEVEHVVVNADFTGAKTYLPWKTLFENSTVWEQACEGNSPEFGQCVEMVMQFKPDLVIIAAGDSCIPTKDFGSPYIASYISRMFRARGVRTLGIGPMFVREIGPFEEFFDGFFRSMVNRSLVDVVLGQPVDEFFGTPVGALPLFEHVWPKGSKTNYVASSFGCSYDCSFCMAPEMTGGKFLFQPVDVFVQDVLDRRRILRTNELYISDMIFPLNIRRLESIRKALNFEPTFQFTCEARTNSIREEMIHLLHYIGIKHVKLGIESIDDGALGVMSKRQTVKKEEEAVTLLRENGFDVTGYLIVGDFTTETEMRQTIDMAKTLDINHWVISVSSYQTFDWSYKKYDSHFSMRSAIEQGVNDQLLWEMLDLPCENPTVSVCEDETRKSNRISNFQLK